MEDNDGVRFMTFTDYVQRLMKAYRCLSCKDFMVAFERVEADGDHLWKQYSVTYKHNLLAFLSYLNPAELKAIMAYIEQKYVIG